MLAGGLQSAEMKRLCFPLLSLPYNFHLKHSNVEEERERIKIIIQLSTMDLLVLASMKNAAKCDKWCELQTTVNHRIFERTLRPLGTPKGHACLSVILIF